MSITIQQNDKPDLDICKMVCDRPLHKKLDDYPLTRDCLNKATTNLFIGKMGSGKTNLIYSFFKSKKLFHKTFHNIYLFQPPHSRASMKDKLFQNGIPDNQIYDELDYVSLKTVADEIEEEDSKYNNIIIFDDQTVALKNKETLKLIAHTINDLADENGWAFLGDVGNLILKKQPNFDPRNYGFQKLTPLIKSAPQFEIDKRETDKAGIKLVYIRNKE